MNKNIFCERKGGATIKKKFYPHPRTSAILAKQIERMMNKKEARSLRKKARLGF